MTNKKPKIITEGYNCVIRNKKKKNEHLTYET